MRPGARSQEPGASREGNRSLTVAALVLLVGGSAWAQSPSKLTNVTFSNLANPSSAIDTTGATLIEVTVMCYDGGGSYPTDPPTPSDNKGNTWTPLASTRIANSLLVQETFIAYGAGLVVGAGHTFTGQSCASGYGWSAEAVSFSGTRTASSPLDASTPVCGTSGGPVTVNLGSFTPSASNTLIFTVAAAYYGATSSLTVTPGSLTIIDQILNGSAQVGASAYQTLGAPSALSVSWTTPQANPSACVMAFDSVAGGGTFHGNQSVIVVGP